jgi:hypothetical protein
MNYFNELSIENIEKIFSYCDKDGFLLYALVCKEFKEILTNKYKKLTLTTKYFTSSLSLSIYAHKYFNKGLDCLNNMKGRFTFYDYSQCGYAAENGCRLCLGYARNMGGAWDSNTTCLAAKNNNIKCLDYCLKYGCELNNATCHWAAYSGNVEALKFCYENNIIWDNLTCELSSKKGHLECLKYARRHLCPWDRLTCIKVAKENGHRHIIDWINLN